MKKQKKPITLQDFSRLGGTARAKSLSVERRKEIAVLAAMARWHGVPVVAADMKRVQS